MSVVRRIDAVMILAIAASQCAIFWAKDVWWGAYLGVVCMTFWAIKGVRS